MLVLEPIHGLLGFTSFTMGAELITPAEQALIATRLGGPLNGASPFANDYKKGFNYGATDELGVRAVEGKMHTNDLHATLLALMGLHHKELTYRYAGRPFRLTDVAGEVHDQIFV